AHAMACGQPSRGRSRLHEAHRGAPLGTRHRCGGGMACATGRAERRLAGIVQSRAHADGVREPALVVKSILIAWALIAIALVAGWIVLRPGMLPHTAATSPAENATTQYLSRGEYLARAGDCVACHTAPTGKPFAGGRAMPTPFGNLYVPNITPDDD